MGKYLGFRSIDITYDYRALFREFDNSVHFTYLGTHKELYSKDKLGVVNKSRYIPDSEGVRNEGRFTISY